MILYDGQSDIDWFYDGLKTFDEMKNDPKYREVVENPVVLRDNGSGKVYGYERADSFALRNGEILDPNYPEQTIQKIFSKQNGTYVDPLYAMSQLLMRAASTFSDDDAKQMASYYPEWQVGIDYKKDWIIRYEKSLYKIAQDHTSQEQWIPGEIGTESLYTNILLDESGHYVWKQPTGAHDAYNKGDIVEYRGALYESLLDGNVWSPDTYPSGWKIYDEESSGTDQEPEPGTGSDDETSYPEFVQPTGAHDAYNKGDIVRYNGELYKSIIDGNVWSPDTYPAGWEKYTEPEA